MHLSFYLSLTCIYFKVVEGDHITGVIYYIKKTEFMEICNGFVTEYCRD